MNHILVVDDEPLMRTWLSKSIPKHSTCFDVPNTAQDVQQSPKIRILTDFCCTCFLCFLYLLGY